MPGFTLLTLEGITGIFLFYGLNPVYHNLIFHVPLLVLVTVFLIPPGIAFAISLLLVAKEVYVKYLKPYGVIESVRGS